MKGRQPHVIMYVALPIKVLAYHTVPKLQPSQRKKEGHTITVMEFISISMARNPCDDAVSTSTRKQMAASVVSHESRGQTLLFAPICRGHESRTWLVDRRWICSFSTGRSTIHGVTSSHLTTSDATRFTEIPLRTKTHRFCPPSEQA